MLQFMFARKVSLIFAIYDLLHACANGWSRGRALVELIMCHAMRIALAILRNLFNVMLKQACAFVFAGKKLQRMSVSAKRHDRKMTYHLSTLKWSHQNRHVDEACREFQRNHRTPDVQTGENVCACVFVCRSTRTETTVPSIYTF